MTPGTDSDTGPRDDSHDKSGVQNVGLHAQARSLTPVAPPSARIGRYQILSRLAMGGMAEVYLARHGELTGFKTLVVLKRVLPHLALDPDFIAMFLDEARIASLLDHPNVVRIYEVGRSEDEYFLAMELVQGKSLSAVIQHANKKKLQLEPKLAALMVAHAAAGLHHAHQLTDPTGAPLGLVHRDVSPQNILISFEGSVKVIDFGVARALGRLSASSTGWTKGKVSYMSPEQARGDDVDARSDIFSLGAVLWEAVTLRRLFHRENEFASMRAVVYDAIPTPSSVATVAPELDEIIMKALQREPAERFQSAEEMRAALESYIFKNGGASTRDLATVMKGWFAEDHVQWQAAARLALDMRDSDAPVQMSLPEMLSGRSGVSAVGTPSAPLPSGISRSLPSLTPPPVLTPNRLKRTTTTNQVPNLSARLPAERRRLGIILVAGVALAALVSIALSWRGHKPQVPAADGASQMKPSHPVVERLPELPPAPISSPKPTTPPSVTDKKNLGSQQGKREIMSRGSRPKKTAAPRSRSGTDSGGLGARRPNPFSRPNPF